jgi:predicted nucleotidyltransferase
VKDNNIIKSFTSKDSLNSKIWSDDKLVPKVRTRLIEIATEFIDFLGVPVVVDDIIFTGSLANYNWSEFSDIDLHVVCDFKQFKQDILPLYQELFKVKKTIFNTDHDIKIYGYEVELYVQDSNEAHFSSGVYSVMFDEWIEKPKKENPNIDTVMLKKKISHWTDMIDTIVNNSNLKDVEDLREYIQKFKDKLKKYRSAGLRNKGEYSIENLVFKYLRRSGHLEKLFNLENDLLDKTLSLD